MSDKKTEVDIAIPGQDGPTTRTVRADRVSKGLALALENTTRHGQTWTVTHVASGLRIGMPLAKDQPGRSRYPSMRKADQSRWMTALLTTPVDWTADRESVYANGARHVQTACDAYNAACRESDTRAPRAQGWADPSAPPEPEIVNLVVKNRRTGAIRNVRYLDDQIARMIFGSEDTPCTGPCECVAEPDALHACGWPTVLDALATNF